MLTFVKHRMGGTEVYARNLVRELAERPNRELQVVAVYANDPDREAGPILVPDGVDTVTEYVLHDVPTGLSHLAKFRLWMHTLLHSRSIWAEIEEVLGGPVDVAIFPFSAVQPKPRGGTRMVTIVHDLQHRELTDSFTFAQRIYRWLTYERPARLADAVITVSDFTKITLERFLGVDPSRIHRVYPGIDDAFITESLPTAQDAEPQERFVYYPARVLPHKNHRRLLEAFELIRAEFPEVTLHLSGSDGELLGALPAYVRHHGNISTAQIRNLYQQCAAVVFPSLYEGFGFPAVEAMAMGSPLVVSEVGSLPEVTHSRVIFIDPYDVSSIAEGIRRGLTSTESDAEAQALAKTYTWQAAVTGITDVVLAVGGK